MVYRCYVKVTFPVFLGKTALIQLISCFIGHYGPLFASPELRTGQRIHVCCSEKGLGMTLGIQYRERVVAGCKAGQADLPASVRVFFYCLVSEML